MSYGAIQIGRQELYEQVWSGPMIKLAKHYGLSDVGLAKTCKRHKIPIPGHGYWAKKVSDKTKAPQQSPLPELSEDKQFLETIYIQQKPDCVSNDNNEITKKIQFGKLEENRIIVSELLNLPHAIIVRTEKSLRGAKPNDRELHAPKARDCLDIQVVPDSIGRALRIMDALVKALGSRGFTLTSDAKKKGPLAVLVNGEMLDFSLEETVKRREHELTPAEEKKIAKDRWYRFSLPRYDFIPTGKLSLKIQHIWHSGIRLTWVDGKIQRVEDCLNDFIAGLVRAAAQKKADRAERERREREWEEERRYREERARLCREEQARVEALEKDVGNWHKSQQIRAYVGAVRKDAIKKHGKITPGSELDEWLMWANQQANRFDPLTESPPSILDEPDNHGFY